MNRNMLRRVELAWPIQDAELRQRIIDELMPDGHYQRPKGAESVKGRSAQAALMARYSAPAAQERV